MPAQQDRVRQDVSIPQHHIMRQVAAHHEIVAISDPRRRSRLAAAMNRHVLANHVLFAQNHAALGGRIKAQILRFAADNRPAADPRPFPHHHMPHQLGMRLDLASRAHLTGPLDHHIGANIGCRVNLGARINQGGLVDLSLIHI